MRWTRSRHSFTFTYNQTVQNLLRRQLHGPDKDAVDVLAATLHKFIPADGWPCSKLCFWRKSCYVSTFGMPTRNSGYMMPLLLKSRLQKHLGGPPNVNVASLKLHCTNHPSRLLDSMNCNLNLTIRNRMRSRTKCLVPKNGCYRNSLSLLPSLGDYRLLDCSLGLHPKPTQQGKLLANARTESFCIVFLQALLHFCA